MAAITAITQLTNDRILLNPGAANAAEVTGELAGDYLPGTIVVYILGLWTAADSGTAAHKLMYWGVVGYRQRINETNNALIPITTAWDASEEKRVPIILSGFAVCRIDDLGAAANIMTGVMVGANAGILELQDNAQIAHGSLATQIADDDVYAIIALGACKGLIWGGVN